MRPIILLCFLFSFLASLFAQENYEYVFQSRHGEINDIAVSNGRLLAGGSIETCREPLVAIFDTDGALLWKTKPYDCGYCKTDDVEFAANGDILVGGDWKEADDYPTEKDGLTIARLDTLGNLLAFRKMTYYYAISRPVSIVESPEGKVLAATKYFLFGFSAQLDSLFTREYALENGELFLDIGLAADTIIVLLTKDRLFLTNLEGEIQREVQAPGPLLDMAITSDSLLFMSADTLYFYEFNNGRLFSIPLPSGNSKGLTVKATEVFLWGEKVYRLDNQAGWQELFPLSLDQRTISQLAYEDGVFYRGGEEVLEASTVNLLNLQLGYVEKIAPDAVPEKDIGVSNIELLEIVSRSVFQEGPGLYFISYNIRVAIEVTNHGASKVSSFILASESQGNFNCSVGRFYQTIVDEVLPPGETLRLEFLLNVRRGSEVTHPDIFEERCFFTGAPDHQFDADFSNNSYCGTILVSAEEPEEAASLRLFPNPSTEVLYIEPPAGMQVEAFEWLNAAGQRVGAGRLPANTPIELSRPGPPGLYWLRLMGREGVVCRPVVWR